MRVQTKQVGILNIDVEIKISFLPQADATKPGNQPPWPTNETFL